MSDNRMYIVHKQTGDKKRICKYGGYGWRVVIDEDSLEAVNKWLHDHSSFGGCGNTDFELEFEEETDEVAAFYD